MDPDLEARLIAIETHLAHQAEEQKELSEVLDRQWRLVEELGQRVARLEGQMKALEGVLAEIEPPEAPPPHY